MLLVPDASVDSDSSAPSGRLVSVIVADSMRVPVASGSLMSGLGAIATAAESSVNVAVLLALPALVVSRSTTGGRFSATTGTGGGALTEQRCPSLSTNLTLRSAVLGVVTSFR